MNIEHFFFYAESRFYIHSCTNVCGVCVNRDIKKVIMRVRKTSEETAVEGKIMGKCENEQSI